MEKYLFLLFITACSLLVVEAHDESLSLSAISDEKNDDTYHRIVGNREWQYEGPPIEFSSRTRKTSPINEYPATPAVRPPLDARYRRLYNPDETASVENFPFVAALLVNGKLWCGAAIVDTNAVITAAHCLQLQYNNRFFREYMKMLSVRVGSNNATAGGELLQVTEIFFHPNYKPQTLEFNFAVLKLHKNLTLSKKSNVGLVPFSHERTVPTDKMVTFLGWGSVLGLGGFGGRVLLQKVELPIYDLADCQEIYGSTTLEDPLLWKACSSASSHFLPEDATYQTSPLYSRQLE